MMCEAARLELVIARRGRDDAKLHELEELYNTRDEPRHTPLDSHSWTLLRQARDNLRNWESRCIDAEIALAECLEKRRDATL